MAKQYHSVSLHECQFSGCNFVSHLPLSLSSAKEINFFLLSILTKVDKHLSEWDNEICEQHLGQGLTVFSESLQIM
jgi:hypothetical protein